MGAIRYPLLLMLAAAVRADATEIAAPYLPLG
jgi:hypothetical protein